MSEFRVSPPRVFPAATRSSRPPAESAGSADAHRQSGFILGDEVDLLLQALEIESDIARRANTSHYRNHAVASTLIVWSRSWLCRLQALHALEWGNYAAAASLVEAGATLLVAVRDLLVSNAEAWVGWLDSGAIAPAHDEHAMQIRLDPASVELPAALGRIDIVLRDALVVAGPSFAASVLLSAPESTPNRVAAVFGDRDFNVALAELNLGWLLALSDAWLEITAADATFPPPEAQAFRRWQADAAGVVARGDRCRLERVEIAGTARYVISNWRRNPGGAPRRILL